MDEARERPAGAAAQGAARARVRAARPEDATELAGLMAGIYHEGRWFVGDGAPEPERLRRRLHAAVHSDEVILIAEQRGPDAQTRLVGWVEMRRFHPRSLRHVATLTLAVAPHARRRGLGRRLLLAGLHWARQVEVRRVRLDVRADNEAAIALYLREGFALEGRERRAIRREDGSFEDGVVMGLWLGPEPR